MLQPVTKLVVDAANMIDTGNLAALLGLAAMLMYIADKVWIVRPTIRSASVRAGAAALALYVLYMVAACGTFDAEFLLHVVWRGLLASAIATGMASLAIAVSTMLIGEPVRWIRRRIRERADARQRRKREKYLRDMEARNAAAQAERERQESPARERARREAEKMASQRQVLVRLRDRIRYDLSLEFKQIRRVDSNILSRKEFADQLEHALAVDDQAEIERRVAALREVFAAVLSKAPNKDKLHRWVNLQGEHEIQQLRRKQVL
jgi:hypothetical protein